jgi:hypothetical protein
MKPKLSELDNVVIDCGDIFNLKSVINKLTIPPSKTQGKYGIFPTDTQLAIFNGAWHTASKYITDKRINDIEL